MNILDIIEKKKIGQKLSKEEIDYFVDGVCKGYIKDFQTTSLLMAICINDLDFDEIYNLTDAMVRSGDVVDLSDLGTCVDKHSTGGVSDTTTLCLVPILADLGVKVAKMSGRSLGFTGGTADKLEVFHGYKTELSTTKFKDLIKKNGASMVSPSQNLALADKIIYKLRSESGTVNNMGLIASSIMSKKIACGAKIIFIDCKYGNGAFMKTIKDAKKLAKIMVEIGKRAGIKVCVIISNMEQPLTNYIGNNLEVYSSIQVLNGANNDLSKLSSFIASKILVIDGKAKNLEDAKIMVKNAIKSKSALNKLKELVVAQEGSTECIDNPKILLKHSNSFEIKADKSGYVYKINTELLGDLSHKLQFFDNIYTRQDDVGFILNKRIGDEVKKGDLLLTCHYNKIQDKQEFVKQLNSCFVIDDKKKRMKLIDCVIE